MSLNLGRTTKVKILIFNKIILQEENDNEYYGNLAKYSGISVLKISKILKTFSWFQKFISFVEAHKFDNYYFIRSLTKVTIVAALYMYSFNEE